MYDFADLFVQGHQNRQRQRLTAQQLAQRQREIDALNRYRQGTLAHQQNVLGFEKERAAVSDEQWQQDYNDRGFDNPYTEAVDRVTPAQFGAYERKRDYEKGQEIVDLEPWSVPFAPEGVTQMTVDDANRFYERASKMKGYETQLEVMRGYAGAQGGATSSGGGMSGAVVRLREIDQALAGSSANDFQFDELRTERGRILASLTPSELIVYNATPQQSPDNNPVSTTNPITDPVLQDIIAMEQARSSQVPSIDQNLAAAYQMLEHAPTPEAKRRIEQRIEELTALRAATISGKEKMGAPRGVYTNPPPSTPPPGSPLF